MISLSFPRVHLWGAIGGGDLLILPDCNGLSYEFHIFRRGTSRVDGAVYLDNSRSSETGVMPVSPQASLNKCFTGRTIAQDSFLKFLSLAWSTHTRLRETD